MSRNIVLGKSVKSIITQGKHVYQEYNVTYQYENNHKETYDMFTEE